MLKLNADGWLEGVEHCVSPNYDARPEGMAVDLLVIHNISLPPGKFAGRDIEAFFTNTLDFNKHSYYQTIRNLKVSAHLLIRRNGHVVQFVSFHDRAWHAGASNFQGRERCNDFSIGIELQGTDTKPFTEHQYRKLAAVTQLLMQHFRGIRRDRITGHSNIAPGRKTDPGPAFLWDKYLSLISDVPAR